MANDEFIILNHTLVDYTGSGGEVIIPDDVIKIEKYVFQNCNTVTSVVIPDSVREVGWSVFEGCSSLKSAVIGSGLNNINWQLFKDCPSLESVTISDGVAKIDDAVFKNCSSLKSITIPKSVEYIGESVFEDCFSLTEINVDADNTEYCSKDGVLFSDSGSTLMVYPAGKKGDYSVPDGTDEIGKRAFENCIGVTGIVIPDSVTELNHNTFQGCSSLKSVNIPSGVTEIGNELFLRCSSLKRIAIHADVENIGEGVFVGCTSLESIYVDEDNPNYRSIGGVLYSADKKTLIYLPANGKSEYTVPDAVTKIGNYACTDCDNLTLTIPNNVRNIGDYKFYKYMIEVKIWEHEDTDFPKCVFSKDYLKTKNKLNANLIDILFRDGLKPDITDAVYVYLFQSMKKLKTLTEPLLEKDAAKAAEIFVEVLENGCKKNHFAKAEEFFTEFNDSIPNETADKFREMRELVK